MKYAIVHITPPSTDIQNHSQHLAYNALVQRLVTASQNHKKAMQLSENVWQIPLEKSLLVLATMFQGCQAQQLQIRVLFLEDPEWISLDGLS